MVINPSGLENLKFASCTHKNSSIECLLDTLAIMIILGAWHILPHGAIRLQEVSGTLRFLQKGCACIVIKGNLTAQHPALDKGKEPALTTSSNHTAVAAEAVLIVDFMHRVSNEL